MSELTKIYNTYLNLSHKSEIELKRKIEEFSQRLKLALEKDCLSSGLEVLRLSCEDSKIEILIRNPETDAIAYASILGLRGGFCLPLNNVSYKREDGVIDFPRGGFYCRCVPLNRLIDRVKVLTKR